jgi:hypothetical protein
MSNDALIQDVVGTCFLKLINCSLLLVELEQLTSNHNIETDSNIYWIPLQRTGM